ncbi:MAG: hypothetical protein ACJAUH_001152 [Saprospiraceae bacterium]|jgi:hypothetical protein
MKLYKTISFTLCLTCLSIYACKKSEPAEQEQQQISQENIDTQNLIGTWKVIDAEKNGEKLNSIEDAIFDFKNDFTLTINSKFPGINKDEPTSYKLNDLTISKVGRYELDFEIMDLTANTMVLEAKIQGIDFKFELENK